ncbi:MAG: hypothetical protein HQK87_02885 [Nitrospinae bacterium]|nr:hypothetical protein [Nitrospinota bacterium]
MKTYQQKALEQDIDLGSQLKAMLAYLGPLCLLPLAFNRQDDFVRYHTRQGVAIWLTEAFAVMFFYIPMALGAWLFTATICACVFFSVVGIVSVFLEKAWHLPFFGLLAELL